MSWPDIHSTFLANTIFASNEDIAVWMMGWFTITDDRRLTSWTMCHNCSTFATSGQFAVMIGLWKWLSGQKQAIWPKWSPNYCPKCHSVMCISTVLGYLISVACGLSILMMEESYCRYAVRKKWDNKVCLLYSVVWFLGLGDVSVCILLLTLHLRLLSASLFHDVMGLILFWSDACNWWTLFKILYLEPAFLIWV